MADESYNLMLDPSMFLVLGANEERRLEVMMNRVSALASEGMAMHVPEAFMTFVEDSYAEGAGVVPLEWFDVYAQGRRQAALSVQNLYGAMNEKAGLIRPFSPDRRMREDHREFAQGLKSAMSKPTNLVYDDRVRDNLQECILQECIFLQERSWIVAQARGAFDRMKEAGSAFLEIGSRDILNKVVRKTRGKKEEEAITTLDKRD